MDLKCLIPTVSGNNFTRRCMLLVIFTRSCITLPVVVCGLASKKTDSTSTDANKSYGKTQNMLVDCSVTFAF